jgi:hypothetical protein
MSTKASQKLKKTVSYSVVILFILTTFLAGYFFYFIPKNKQIIHNNGFLILKTISENIKVKSEQRLNLYQNFYKEANDKNVGKIGVDSIIEERLVRNKLSARFKQSEFKRNGGNNASFTIDPGKRNDSITRNIKLEDNAFVYSIQKWNKDTVVFYENITDFLQPILSTQKDELFKFYAIAKIKGKLQSLIYSDPDFGIRSDIPLDTLVPKNPTAYLNGINDIQSQNFNLKMFYYPFNIDTIQLQVYGFVETERYNSTLRQVPLGFVYPLAIAFLLLLFFLPILKLYIMDSNEQLKISDLVLFSVSVFMGVSMITLVITQYMLWVGEEERIKENLDHLSAKISQSFLTELDTVYSQLETLDQKRKNDSLSIERKLRRHKTLDYSGPIRNYIRDSGGFTGYYKFDRISWIDSTGEQVIKAEMEGEPVYANVSERKYFQAIRSGSPLVLGNSTKSDSGTKTKQVGWEPIYSWTNGDFNISISKQAGKYIEALATKMYSVVNTLLPVGYGFCIIDNDGTVQVHSDVKRNLRENLFEKAQPSKTLRGVIASRQESTINDVVMYGKLHIMSAKPIKYLPYTIITFYDKGALFPVNMRIFIFTLLFCLIFGVICLILWITLARTGFKTYPLVYCPMDCLDWLSPRRKESTYYLHGCIFLALYALIFILFAFFYNSYEISNYSIFSMMLLTPVNIVLVLFSLRVCYNQLIVKEGNLIEGEHTEMTAASISLRIKKIQFVHFLIAAVYFFISKTSDYPVGFSFVIFQLLFLSWIRIDKVFSKSKFRAWLKKRVDLLEEHLSKIFIDNVRKMELDATEKEYRIYLRRYTSFVTLLIICLSVLPGALFTWYAYNQELMQTVKRQQLHLASNLESRGNEIISSRGDTLLLPRANLKQLLYHQGIYTLNNTDSICFEKQNRLIKHDSLNLDGNHNKTAYEQFYFTIAEAISYPYYDPRVFPALEDYSADGSWQWHRDKKKLYLHYYNVQLPFHSEEAQTMLITFELPERFRFLNWRQLPVLIFFISLLIMALYKWIQRNAENVFLVKYLKEPSKIEPTGSLEKTGFIKEYYERVEITGKPAIDPNEGEEKGASKPFHKIDDNRYYYGPDDYPGLTTATHRLELVGHEKKILELVRAGEDLYEFVWNKCSEKEQYMLIDFAKDGLINYKNTREIYNMIHNGVFMIDTNYTLRLFNPGFRAFLLLKAEDANVIDLHKKFQLNSTWQALRGPLLLLLFGFAAAIFFTQEAVFHKFIALAGGVATIVSLIPKMFVGSNSKVSNEKEK